MGYFLKREVAKEQVRINIKKRAWVLNIDISDGMGRFWGIFYSFNGVEGI